jgi:hypothetical protein
MREESVIGSDPNMEHLGLTCVEICFERAEVREHVCAILSAENAANEYFHYQCTKDVFGDISNPGVI